MMVGLLHFQKKEHGNSKRGRAFWMALFLFTCYSFLSTAFWIATFFRHDIRLLEIEKLGSSSLYFSSIYDYNRVKNNKDLWKDRALKKIGLIHIGKCGGVSVKRTLETTNNAIWKRGIRFYHMIPPLEKHVDALEDWIITVRDPIERIQSNWIYAHPDNNIYRRDKINYAHNQKKLYDCYPTLDDAATKGLTLRSNRINVCPEFLRKILAGKLEKDVQLIHFQRNYRYHLDPLLQNDAIEKKRVYVVRTDNMLGDLNAINRAYWGKSSVFQRIDNHSHFWDPSTQQPPRQLLYDNRTLSEEGMANLCWVLCDEIQIYKQMLRMAKNLKTNQVKESMNRLAQHCPEQANSDELVCDSRTSNIWIKDGIHLNNDRKQATAGSRTDSISTALKK